jgi:hypothetical protein
MSTLDLTLPLSCRHEQLLWSAGTVVLLRFQQSDDDTGVRTMKATDEFGGTHYIDPAGIRVFEEKIESVAGFAERRNDCGKGIRTPVERESQKRLDVGVVKLAPKCAFAIESLIQPLRKCETWFTPMTLTFLALSRVSGYASVCWSERTGSRNTLTATLSSV